MISGQSIWASLIFTSFNHTTKCHRCQSFEETCNDDNCRWVNQNRTVHELSWNGAVSFFPSRLQEIGSNWPHLQDHLRPAPWTTDTTATEILHNLFQTVSSLLLICVLVILTRVLTWLDFVVVTDLCGQMLTSDGVLNFVEVFSKWIKASLHCTGQRYDSIVKCRVRGLPMSMVWVPQDGCGVMVWLHISYRQLRHFIDLNACSSNSVTPSMAYLQPHLHLTVLCGWKTHLGFRYI